KRPMLASHQRPQLPRPAREGGPTMDSTRRVNQGARKSEVDIPLRLDVGLEFQRELLGIARMWEHVPGAGAEGGDSLLRRRLVESEEDDWHAGANAKVTLQQPACVDPRHVRQVGSYEDGVWLEIS